MTMTQCKAFQLYPQMDGIAKPSPLPLKLGGGGVAILFFSDKTFVGQDF